MHQHLGRVGAASHQRNRRSPRRAIGAGPGKPPEDPTAGLAAFTVPGQAQAVHASIQEKIKESGAEDMVHLCAQQCPDSWHTECSFKSMNVCRSVLPLENEITDSQVRRFGKAQILIAEDDSTLAQDLKCKIENLDYEVAGITHSGEEAVVLADRLRPDLVLMDIQLAGEIDGIEAAEQIRTLRIPLIYVSGSCDSPTLQRAQLTEPYGYILKPYRTSDLRISVEMSLQRHRAEQDRERLLKRFQDVLASVKTLTGRLSICCYCKKIKDEVGEWPEVETYVMKHSHASFTHGMCPDCFTRVQKRMEAIEEVDAPSGSVVLG